MELVLLLIAGVVVYYLYNALQDYLKNPLHQNPQQMQDARNDSPIVFDNPYVEMSREEKARGSEFGVLAAILGRVAWSDGQLCALEKQLLNEMLSDMAAESKNPKLSVSDLEEIIAEQKESTLSLEELCEEYVALTKGEYKKRLKVVEFLFALSYADGELSQGEEECIVDIAAFFELTNEDFNSIYEAFKLEQEREVPMSLEKAKAIFGLSDTADFDTHSVGLLKEKYHALIKEAKQNIFESKSINKSFQEVSFAKIKEIERAYQFLLETKDFQGDDNAKSTKGSLDSEISPKAEDNASQKNTSSSQSASKTRKGWDF